MHTDVSSVIAKKSPSAPTGRKTGSATRPAALSATITMARRTSWIRCWAVG
ncbi:Uncharacterised protein [Mycobacterium tuberculosis]|uniref:Uncharacterized protein n=1 Tax=Mycobacterium tuberculosis TaxID=1773 RepID=A0A655AJE9_MYCTX|nr:Uncharacterised protein [Mycobacterium tuberculosis]CKP49170.1 Uncharacterised protein [Mycobacterium tuberculosis]CKT31455.1 Uncharacterised protein [Mycobacterium tuberculosis]CKT41735.1 Uncharacterised protein [Mycobacterium tuberculosis]CKU25481.1 Uncharacterised protein [Mycobacterium tuberculosis]